MFAVTREQIEYLLNEMNNHDINEVEISVDTDYNKVTDVTLELWKTDNKGKAIYWKMVEAKKE